MPWALAVLGGFFYYLIRSLGTGFYLVWRLLRAIFDLILVILAPAIHLASYIAYGFLVPVYFLSRFEVCFSK